MTEHYTDEDVQTLAAFICDDTVGGLEYTRLCWHELGDHGDEWSRLLRDARRILDLVSPAIAANALRQTAGRTFPTLTVHGVSVADVLRDCANEIDASGPSAGQETTT